MNTLHPKAKVAAILLLGGVLPLAASMVADAVFGPAARINEPAHEFLEIAGSCIAVEVSLLLLLQARHQEGAGHLAWVAAALVGMGVLDAAHGIAPFGPAWSWLRHGGTLTGGVLFALVWIRPPVKAGSRMGLFVLSIGALALGTAVLVWARPDWLPEPWTQGDRYAGIVKLANALGGLGFFVASLFFFRRYLRVPKGEELVFASYTLLFGTSSVLFGFSQTWAADWWVWHGFRFLAYGVVLLSAYKGVLVLYAAIARGKAELEERVRQRTAALREANERNELVLAGAGAGIWDWDLLRQRVVYSPRWKAMRGFADEEVGEGLEEWRHGIHPEDVGRVLAALQAHFEGKTECFAEEYRVRRKDGSWMWVADRGLARRDGTGQLVRMAGSETEITQQKEFQAELERLVAERTARLQELVGELEHFSYTITHDMRAPLRAMRGFAEMASSACDEKGDRELKGFLGKISTSAERMDALIRDALNYSRAVRQELPLEDVDAGALLRGMLDTYPEFQPDRARIRFESRLPVVVANAAGLTQIFSNLLGNAVKFVKPGQIPEVRISAERRAGWVRIWVQDQGIGIPKPMLPRVFDMFSRGSRDYEGTGIGLALVRKVAQRMGGRVGVESKEGEGSRFWVDLQLGQSESGTGEAEPPSGP